MVPGVVARRRAIASRGSRIAERMLQKIWPICASRPGIAGSAKPFVSERNGGAGPRGRRPRTSAPGSLIRMTKRELLPYDTLLPDPGSSKNTYLSRHRGRSLDFHALFLGEPLEAGTQAALAAVDIARHPPLDGAGVEAEDHRFDGPHGGRRHRNRTIAEGDERHCLERTARHLAAQAQ